MTLSTITDKIAAVVVLYNPELSVIENIDSYIRPSLKVICG